MNKGRLRITNITTHDNGVYACSASNRAGEAKSQDAYLINMEGKTVFYILFTLPANFKAASEAKVYACSS